MIRKIELLAPAKNLECAIEAINHGADAVYMGAPAYSARYSAGVSLEDIAAAVVYAHQFDVKIYIAINTILTDSELVDAEAMIWKLYHIGVDALIIQDMGITRLHLPPIALHASTQVDNRDVEKIAFLEAVGFTQIVLARELTISQIKEVAQRSPIALECFVHGALCVSYSGQCYISQALTGRSANRGTCAQYCRLPYTLKDANGQVLAQDKHLLSLKDLHRAGDLEALIDAGVTSFKIEGRLKDLSYVKNITAYYRQCLDKIIAANSGLQRASLGLSTVSFTPDPYKSFNRGLTPYQLDRDKADIASVDSPKSYGKMVGWAYRVGADAVEVEQLQEPLHNGDGVCFINEQGQMEGFRVNKALSYDSQRATQRLYPLDMPRLLGRKQLYRNLDIEFEKQLSKPTAIRRVGLYIALSESDQGYVLTLTDDQGIEVSHQIDIAKSQAHKPQSTRIIQELSKVGDTIFDIQDIKLSLCADYFIPASILSQSKREALSKLMEQRKQHYTAPAPFVAGSRSARYPYMRLDYRANIHNREAAAFYQQHGVEHIEYSFESQTRKQVPLMFTKHCLKYYFGWCPKQPHLSDYTAPAEPLSLHYKDTMVTLSFDCRSCMMVVEW